MMITQTRTLSNEPLNDDPELSAAYTAENKGKTSWHLPVRAHMWLKPFQCLVGGSSNEAFIHGHT